jgi:hypothetical protein
MWGISILADFTPKYGVVFGLVKDLLFQYVLGHCGLLRNCTQDLFLS